MSKVFKGLLKEVNIQLVARNQNKYWKDQLIDAYKSNNRTEQDAKDILTYFTSNRNHREMMERYWPVSTLTPEEKIKRTANKVGFSLPIPGKPLEEGELSPFTNVEREDQIRDSVLQNRVYLKNQSDSTK